MRVKPADASAKSTAQIVKCPGCGGPSVYSQGNAYRPFCSAHCKQIDLGAWASEQFTVPLSSDSHLLSEDSD